MMTNTKPRLRNLGLAWLIFTMMASLVVLMPASSASAQPADCAKLSAQKDRGAIVGGSWNCYYAVTDTGDWSEECEGYGWLFCSVDVGKYRVDAFDAKTWDKVASYDLTIKISCRTAFVNGSTLDGGSGHCHYAVTDTDTWKQVCSSRGHTLFQSCRNLDDGRYKVDVYGTSPWKKERSYYVNVPR